MNQRGVPPSLEQLWSDEVRYLHSLWHRGPPRNPNPNPKPKFNDNLRPSNPTIFKKESETKTKTKTKTKKKRGGKKKNANNNNEYSNPPQVSEFVWPCKPEPKPREEIGWPEPDSQSGPSTRPASAEEQAKLSALQFQQKGLMATQDFFSNKVGSVNEGEDNEEDDEEDWMESDGDEPEELKFFLGIFMEYGELRDYYEKNCDSGEFCCLVCCGIGKKVGKRFKNCVSLVQHSTAISKTKRKRAHRAFGQAICRVLGWDFKRLPNIVLSTGEPLGHVLAQEESKVDLEECGTSGNVVDSVDVDNGESMDFQMGLKEDDGNDQRNSLEKVTFSKEDDANEQKKDLDKEIAVTMGINNLELVDCTVSSKEDVLVREEQDLCDRL